MALSAQEWARVWCRAIATLSPPLRERLAKARGRRNALACAGALVVNARCQALLEALLDECLSAAEQSSGALAVVGQAVLQAAPPKNRGVK